MVPQNHHMPAWQKGLIKRKWIYLVVVLVSLLILGDGYLKRLSIPRNKEKPTFEELAVRINQRDAILISTWRGIWAKLPVGIQSRVPHWAPSPPADQIRLAACSSLAGHGEKAFPLVLEKLGDSDQRMRHTALRSLFHLKISNQQTWESISQTILDNGNSMSIRRQAFLVLAGLHWQEPRFGFFLEKLIESDLDLIKSLKTIPVYSLLSSSSPMVAGAVSPESELLSFLMFGLSDSFFFMLFEKEHPDLSEIALRFMRGTVINTQQFQSTIIKFLKVEGDITRESAYLGLLRSRKGNENWKDGSSYFFMAAGDSSPSIQMLAVQFLSYDQEISSEIQNTLFELISSCSQEVAFSALSYLQRCKVRATALQLKVVEKLARDGDPLCLVKARELLEQILWTPVH